MREMSVMGAMRSIVPITRFNKGEASRIFDEVKAGSPKMVLKNNQPVCVLLAPEQYENLIEMLSDQILLEEAESRMERYTPQDTMTRQEIMESLGITQDELDGVDVEIE